MYVGSAGGLHAQIIYAVASVTSQLLDNMWHETGYHLDILQVEKH